VAAASPSPRSRKGWTALVQVEVGSVQASLLAYRLVNFIEMIAQLEAVCNKLLLHRQASNVIMLHLWEAFIDQASA
jgi:hypothetical protein